LPPTYPTIPHIGANCTFLTPSAWLVSDTLGHDVS
jgi:hypothetical protein